MSADLGDNMPEKQIKKRPFEKINGLIQAHKSKAGENKQQWDEYLSLYTVKTPKRQENPTGSAPDYSSSVMEIQTNYPFAFVDTVVAMVAPVNPKVEVVPRLKSSADSAKIQEALINFVFTKQKMNEVIKSAAAKAVMYGCSFVKSVWNTESGTTLLYEKDPRKVWFDVEAPRWEDIRYLVEVTIIPEEVFKERTESGKYNKEVAESITASGYPEWLEFTPIRDKKVEQAAKDAFKWVVIYEVYDFEYSRYYQVAEDTKAPLYEGALPYKYAVNPFTMLTFNNNLVDISGLSDIQLIYKLQGLLNEIDTLELQHAATAIPGILIDTRALDNISEALESVRRITSPNQMVPVNVSAGKSLADLFSTTPQPQLSPSFDKLRQRVIEAMEFTLGLPQYARGVVGATTVATEAALADTALRTRTGTRIKSINTLMSDIALKIIGLYAQFMPEGKQLFIKPSKTEDELEVTRANMNLEKFSLERYFWDYEAIEYSPLDNNRSYRSQQLQVFWSTLSTSPFVDQAKLMAELLDLLKLGQVFTMPPPAPPQMPLPGPTGPGEMPPELAPTGGATPLSETPLDQPVDESGLPNMAAGQGQTEQASIDIPGRPPLVGKVP